MAVGNSVTGDSRVEKMADTARRAGYDVTLVGVKHKNTHTFGAYEGVPIFRPTPDWSAYNAWIKSAKNRARITEEQIDTKLRDISTRGITAKQSLHDLADGIGELPKLIAPMKLNRLKPPRIGWVDPVIDRSAALATRMVRPQANMQHLLDWMRSAKPGAWREIWKQIEGYESLFLDAFRELRPDVIHVHDRHPLSAAHLYSVEESKHGRVVKWLYDAHEYLPGQRFSGPISHRIGWLAMEREMIQHAHSVVTVSDELASTLMTRHSLDKRPETVANAPAIHATMPSPRARVSLRNDLMLDEDTPLMVYVGKLAARRGIYTALESLAHLPGVHLAFVGSRDVNPRQQLRQRAVEIGVDDRLHIVDYVPSRWVPTYISSATIGLSPLYFTPAHELALATKIREYLQAGLPIVASDLAVQGSFIRETGVGATHKEQDSVGLAQAVSTVLSSYFSFASKITDELKQSHSWESQEKVLLKEWRTISSGSPQVEPVTSPLPPIPCTTTPPELTGRLQSIIAAIKRLGLRPILYRSGKFNYLTESNGWVSVEFPDADRRGQLKAWAELVSCPGVFVIENFMPLLPDSVCKPEDVRALFAASGVRVIYDIPDSFLDDPYECIQRFPECFWSDFPPPAIRRTVIRRRRLRKLISAWKLDVTSSQPGFDLVGDNKYWLPAVVEPDSAALEVGGFGQRGFKQASHLRVGVVSTGRSDAEVDLIRAAVAEIGGVIFGLEDSDAHSADLSIGSLTTGQYSEADLRWISLGVPVIANVSDAVRSSIGHSIPIIQADLDTISLKLQSLSKQPDTLRQTALLGKSFLQAVHSPTALDSALNRLLTHDI